MRKTQIWVNIKNRADTSIVPTTYPLKILNHIKEEKSANLLFFNLNWFSSSNLLTTDKNSYLRKELKPSRKHMEYLILARVSGQVLLYIAQNHLHLSGG